MTPNGLDWTIVLVSIAACFVPALVMARRAGQSTAEFFTSGRAAPWWLIGVSMVATTFSTDTPNLVTDLVRTGGVANNWQWWAFLLTGMLTVFFFARLWRRSGVLTDLEFYELRYAGRAASLVRGFRAIYLGLLFNGFIMATVNLAAAKIANVVLGWPMTQTLLICAVLNVLFAATGGLWGVMYVDLIQFGIAMTGAVAVAWFALAQPEVGGMAGLVERLPATTLALVPDFGDWGTALSIFVIPLTVQWWSVWYPGAEPGGGSYVAQRMLAARSERDALGGTLFFNAAHYALRSWPWILVALASLLVFPDLEAIRVAFPHVDPRLVGHDMAYPAMLKFLPHGFLGIMIAGMLAAYVSTIVTHLNWGASYLVHDFWRRFIRPDASEGHYVAMGRLTTVLLMALAAGLTFVLDTASQAFQLLLSIGAGTGLLYLLRWFWWRINAWCEIVAMVVSFGVATVFFLLQKQGQAIPSHVVLLSTVGITTVAWVVTAFVTPAEPRETLVAFYRKIRPAGPGWQAIRASEGLEASPDSLPQAFLAWTLGCLAVYGALFGTGSWLYGHTGTAVFWTAVATGSTLWLVRLIPSLWRGAPVE
ncbi:MAG: Na+:solute symporter [Gemmatimonadetes bacterium]|nr:Na+:solute symporter [Gemmatimonadota bacterium]MCB9505159.1 Na+:solute symporter [Gemmatimonadales bacterium]MCA9762162.1 Na+:solute symporter [Gemmatimonadota bacterium]MCA9769201.1 Na+:solute symporter [Gemmatimonadota bacterium]MCB9518667.1 Na+:solute symporter [Gemmatimonadales bacterium]